MSPDVRTVALTEWGIAAIRGYSGTDCDSRWKARLVQNPMLLMIIMLVVMAVPMFLMSRGQRKRVQQHQELVKSLGVGDEVRTHSGFYGMIVEEEGDTVILETEDGSQLKWNRNAIAERVDSFGENSTEATLSDAPASDADLRSDAAKSSDFLADDSKN